MFVGDEGMSIQDIIPTCDDAMSCYTLCALTILASAGFLAFTVMFRWASNENRRLEKNELNDVKRLEACIKRLESMINGHDEYIDDTNDILNKIQIELAVQQSSQVAIKADIAEIKALIGKINETLMEMKR